MSKRTRALQRAEKSRRNRQSKKTPSQRLSEQAAQVLNYLALNPETAEAFGVKVTEEGFRRVSQ